MRKIKFALFFFIAYMIFTTVVYAQGPITPPKQTPVLGCTPDWQKTCELVEVLLKKITPYFYAVLGSVGFWVGGMFVKSMESALIKNLEKKWDVLFDIIAGGYIHLYLKKFIEDNRHFKFRGLVTRIRRIDALELDQVYVSIFMQPESYTLSKKNNGVKKSKKIFDEFDDSEHRKPYIVNLTRAIQDSDKLAIVGAVGSGKTSLLQWAGLKLARQWTRKKRTNEIDSFVQAVKEPLVPIIISLGAFNNYCQVEKKGQTAQALLDFMRVYIVNKHPLLRILPENFFSSLFKKTGCMLMLDGLDEVARDDRMPVRQAIEDLVRDFKSNSRNRYIVTSRTAAYFGESEISGFRKYEVQNLTIKQRDGLIKSWFNTAYGGSEAILLADDLIQRLSSSNPGVRALAITPLMVTIISLMHYNQFDLPKQRAELYEHAVRIILTEPYHEGNNAAELKDDWESICLQLSWIAFKMHTDKSENLSEDNLVDFIWSNWGAPPEEGLARDKARSFIRKAADRGDLLEEENGRYGFFTHRTFREFLVGRCLAKKFSPSGQEFLKQELEQRLDDDNWIEPIRLLTGYLAIGGDDDISVKFIRLIYGLGMNPEQNTYALMLASLCVADLPVRESLSLERISTERDIAGKMLLMIENSPPVINVRLRNKIGRVLGKIGDPRLPTTIENDVKIILPKMVLIPSNAFRMGVNEDDEKILEEQSVHSWDNEKPAHEILLSKYSIGKYPVTNAEFCCFVEQGGYNPNAAWWDENGRKWLTGVWDSDLSWISDENTRKQYKYWLSNRTVEKRNRPFWWDDPKWNGSNLPVVGVSWFEVHAYCNWLSCVTSKQFRLPTEAEWEHAARGADGFMWAWGNKWDSDKANTDEAQNGINGTSPVGIYPNGESSYGVQDMIGNVWEWCSDWFDDKQYKDRLGINVENPYGAQNGSARVLRGGSWNYNRSFARCSYRSRYDLCDYGSDIGFRLVCSSIPIDL